MVSRRTRSTVTTKDGITWYYEQEGSGPHVVLIPDGLGECQMMDKPMSLIAAEGFTVTTFDMPGMSRSSNAPPETYQDITAQKLATMVIGLMDQLDIQYATFWGCSSGALAVLALCADYPERVRNGLPHEAPTWLMGHLADLLAQDADSIAATMAFHSKAASGNHAAWDGLGDEVHERLRKNYPRWAHGYITKLTQSAPISDEDLHKRPIDWTVGAGTPTWQFFNNVVIATKAGISIKTLPGNHFPYISHPEDMAKYLVETTRKYL
ncbi:hypothetical protein CLAIMM_12990 [Cladophialophora immunda]|nr:hypothetical protein CLAIMM_12990 [Cladophialophora immunda]